MEVKKKISYLVITKYRIQETYNTNIQKVLYRLQHNLCEFTTTKTNSKGYAIIHRSNLDLVWQNQLIRISGI